jgi:REP element-mobilizing transposase RayT
MGKLKRFLLPNYCYFITIVVKDRKKLLLDEGIYSIILKDLEFYREKYDYLLHAYVMMPDHLHLLLSLKELGNVSIIMRDFKSHTAQMINKALNRKGTLWQQGFYDHVIRDERDFVKRINYIHKNPVTSELVEDLEDYKFSSYRNYFMEDDSLIRIDRLQW